MEHKCIFCNSILDRVVFNDNFYLCINKHHHIQNMFALEYYIPTETNKILYMYFIHTRDDKEYRVEYRFEDQDCLIVRDGSLRISREIVRIPVKKDTYPITPDNCTQKLSYYLTFS